MVTLLGTPLPDYRSVIVAVGVLMIIASERSIQVAIRKAEYGLACRELLNCLGSTDSAETPLDEEPEAPRKIA